MNKSVLLHATFLCLLSACAVNEPEISEKPAMTGADKDAHGCIASAGYAWCERSNQCERPWELAAQEGFDNTANDFQQYCEGATQ